jgi:hypothetical protein
MNRMRPNRAGNSGRCDFGEIDLLTSGHESVHLDIDFGARDLGSGG